MTLFLIKLSLLMSGHAFAHLEYSARYNIVSCRACHVSPAGGGPRTFDGKLFGAHGYQLNGKLVQDYVSADFRALYYYPQRVTSAKGGLAVMAAAISGHAALDEQKKVELVVGTNIAGFSAAPLYETYVLYNFSNEPAWLETMVLGRIRPAFGIMTDEHRTYTRIQTATDWNSYETGAMVSGQAPVFPLHLDATLVSGEKSPGNSLPQAAAVRWGTLLNARYMLGPAIVGVSFSYHRHDPRSDSRTAWSLYSVISVSRWSENRVPLTLELETVHAANWGAALGRGFAADLNYVNALGGARSEGWMVKLIWSAVRNLDLIYKLDYLVPDRNYPADVYDRHGVGLRWFAGPGVIAQVRYELARATPPSEAESTATAAQDAAFGILQLSF